jgi:hypothetical protein
MSKLKRIAFIALVGAGGALACGGVAGNATRVEARDSATQATCDKYNMCGAIGVGKTYETIDSCKTIWQGNWENQWPIATCEGKINQPALNLCLSAIAGTVCTSIADILTTLYVKCSAAMVCPGGTPADGGSD